MNSLAIDLQWAFNFVVLCLVGLMGLLKKAQDDRIDTLRGAYDAVSDRVTDHGKELARLGAQHDSVFDRLDRIEAKLDRVLEDRIG